MLHQQEQSTQKKIKTGFQYNRKRDNMIKYAVFISLFQLSYQLEAPIIQTKSGKISGIIEESFSGINYFSYLGIPFAEPPIGNLRFKVSF